MADSFKPTQKMAAAARRGLRLRTKFGRGGTEVGVSRAHQLAEQRDLDVTDVKAMHSFFPRHAIDNDTQPTMGPDSDPSAGFIAWLLGRRRRKGLGRSQAQALRKSRVRRRRTDGEAIWQLVSKPAFRPSF